MTLTGFLLFMIGMLSLMLSTVGIHFSFLRFLEMWGSFVALFLKILLIIAGFVLIYLSKIHYPSKS